VNVVDAGRPGRVVGGIVFRTEWPEMELRQPQLHRRVKARGNERVVHEPTLPPPGSDCGRGALASQIDIRAFAGPHRGGWSVSTEVVGSLVAGVRREPGSAEERNRSGPYCILWSLPAGCERRSCLWAERRGSDRHRGSLRRCPAPGAAGQRGCAEPARRTATHHRDRSSQLKRYLPEPVRRLDLHDLVMSVTDRVVGGVAPQPKSCPW
jgi:hypothetical protein